MKQKTKIINLFKWPKGKTGQDIQDDLFKKMSAERKIELWSNFFKLIKDLSKGKIHYETNRPKRSSG